MQTLLIHGLTILIGNIGIWLIYSSQVDQFLFYTGIFSLLLTLMVLLVPLHRTVVLLFYSLLNSLLVAITIIHADNTNRFGPLLRESVDALFQTSRTESIDYLSVFLSPWSILLAGILIVANLFTAWRIQVTARQARFCLASFPAALALLYASRQLPVSIIDAAAEYADIMERFEKTRGPVIEPYHVQSDFRGNVIIVMAESLARRNMGVYGYLRQTTPYLTRMKSSLAIFHDVISPHSHTVESLPLALTFNAGGKPFEESADLINIAREAGFETWWLSNQNAIGIWDNAVSALASQADRVRYHDPSSGVSLKRTVHDMALIPSLDEALSRESTGGKLIFLHLMAAHFPYCAMVPAGFDNGTLRYDDPPFDDRVLGNWLNHLRQNLDEQQFIRYFSSVNCYDRAVSYIDSVVGKVLDRAAAEEKPTAVLLVADHGEAAIFDSGHESRMHSHLHVEIPFILWRNRSYDLPLHIDPERAATLADLSYSISQLLGIRGIPEQSSRSLFSGNYAIEPRRTLGKRLGYDVFDGKADNVERARANLRIIGTDKRARVHAHRMNTAGSLLEAREFFSGVEMDMVYDPVRHRFGIYHPPAPDAGLTLELQLRQDRKTLHYWLDWKNAGSGLMEDALERLESLDRLHRIKSRTLVETGALDGSAAMLEAAGWKTSFYLPTGLISGCLQSCTREEARLLGRKLWQQFDQNGFSAISFDIRLLAFVESEMLSRLKHDNIDAHTWATDIDLSSPDAPRLLQPFLDREWLDTILVTFPNHFWR